MDEVFTTQLYRNHIKDVLCIKMTQKMISMMNYTMQDGQARLFKEISMKSYSEVCNRKSKVKMNNS